MAAEFHLAEKTFALHLLLQCPEGLVDIVVANENLHAGFPLDSTDPGYGYGEFRFRRQLWYEPRGQIQYQRQNGVRMPNHQLNNAKATVRNEKMKLITTWHCTEILQGEESETTPREWLILAGPGEDLIFEVKTAPPPPNKPDESVTRH